MSPAAEPAAAAETKEVANDKVESDKLSIEEREKSKTQLFLIFTHSLTLTFKIGINTFLL